MHVYIQFTSRRTTFNKGVKSTKSYIYIYIYIYIYSSPVAAPAFSRPDWSCQMALSDCFGVPSRSGPGQRQLSQGAGLPQIWPQMASPHHRRTTFWAWEGPRWIRWPSEGPQGFPWLLLMMLIWGASWTPKTTPLDTPVRMDTF